MSLLLLVSWRRVLAAAVVLVAVVAVVAVVLVAVLEPLLATVMWAQGMVVLL